MQRRTFLTTSGTALAWMLSPAGTSSADDAATRPFRHEPYDDQQHTDDLFKDIPRRLEYQPGAAFDAWKTRLRERVRELVGVTTMQEEVPFHGRAEKAESVRLDGYTREKWYLWTEPDVPLPIWVLIPDRPLRRPLPLVVAVHGHNQPEIYLGIAQTDAEKKAIVEGDRDIAVQAAHEGYLCVLLTSRGFGETRRADDIKARSIKSCRTALMHGMLFGRTMIGYRVWDVSRVLDWVLREYPVDSNRIAITGNSGGGTTSLFAAACEERIKVAVPSCYFCTFQASIGSIYHCECNYVPGLLREAEMYDVAGLIAPRPFLAIAGQSDPIFPLAAVRQSFSRLQQIYRAAGAGELCELFVGEGGHRYYKQASWPFIRTHFA